VVTICTASLTFSSSTFCPHSVFMCFVWIWEQTAIISLYCINWLVFITETECVYCAVRDGYINAIIICDVSNGSNWLSAPGRQTADSSDLAEAVEPATQLLGNSFILTANSRMYRAGKRTVSASFYIRVYSHIFTYIHILKIRRLIIMHNFEGHSGSVFKIVPSYISSKN
jgi:hypothetical protein